MIPSGVCVGQSSARSATVRAGRAVAPMSSRFSPACLPRNDAAAIRILRRRDGSGPRTDSAVDPAGRKHAPSSVKVARLYCHRMICLHSIGAGVIRGSWLALYGRINHGSHGSGGAGILAVASTSVETGTRTSRKERHLLGRPCKRCTPLCNSARVERKETCTREEARQA